MGVVKERIQDLIEQLWHSIVQILGVERVLLHFLELMVLEEIAQEPIMGLLHAL